VKPAYGRLPIMTKAGKVPPGADDEPRIEATLRLPKALDERVKVYALVTGRTKQDLIESAIDPYLKSLPLTADQKRKIRVLGS